MLQENSDMGRDKSGTEAEKLKLKVSSQTQIVSSFILQTTTVAGRTERAQI
jgi:hypothetical protein